MSAPPREEDQPRRTLSEVHKSWWPGWIWGVPIAAVGIVVWLLIRALSDNGIDATVVFDEAAGMKVGDTKVVRRGMNVGTLRHLTLAPDGWHVIAELNLDKSIQKYLRSGTRFYLDGAHPSLSDPTSLKAIIAGPTIVMESGTGAPARHFSGVMGSPPESLAVALPYIVRFSTPVGQLKVGSPVSLLGFAVGEVASVQLTTDAANGKIIAVVLVLLDPTRFHIQRSSANVPDWAALMNTTLGQLARRGLRARVIQDPPLVGSQRIALEMRPDSGQGVLRTSGRYPEIPVDEGGGLEQVLTQAGQLPLGAIGENVRTVTERLKALTSSPQLQDSINQLDRTLAELAKTVHQAAPQVEPTLESLHQTVDSLRRTAVEIDATAAVATRTIGGNPSSANGNLQQSLRELTEAARAIRTLANDLDQHPESVLRGRSESTR